MNRGPVTQEQIDAWAAYQAARADMGLLTDVEAAAVFGGRTIDAAYLDADARR